ncbi:hypothetical protein AGLY_005211 [Aphis glycines]|uniref:Uncharacterized protein n=1 Tax=Aphis glycines TaxID=307491 RepID=A0A6G0TYD8_APHGL|nr:hypothetical protein AGLY_005211 [Aphis glycines]
MSKLRKFAMGVAFCGSSHIQPIRALKTYYTTLVLMRLTYLSYSSLKIKFVSRSSNAVIYTSELAGPLKTPSRRRISYIHYSKSRRFLKLHQRLKSSFLFIWLTTIIKELNFLDSNIDKNSLKSKLFENYFVEFSNGFQEKSKKQNKKVTEKREFLLFDKIDCFIQYTVVSQKLITTTEIFDFSEYFFFEMSRSNILVVLIVVNKNYKSLVPIFYFKRLKFKILQNMSKSRKLTSKKFNSFPSRSFRENSKCHYRKNVMKRLNILRNCLFGLAFSLVKNVQYFLNESGKTLKKMKEKRDFLRKTSFRQNRIFYFAITQKLIDINT